MTHSTDDGKNFGPAMRVDLGDTGSCACCALGAITDRDGTLYISYRAAGENTHRDMTLLKSTNFAQSFAKRTIDSWYLNACPVTTTALAQKPQTGALVAWETRGRVYFADVDKLSKVTPAGPPPASGRQKDPAVAVNRDGQTLLVWGVGEGWASGGILHWQVFEADGSPTNQKGKRGNMPTSSVPEVVVLPDGRFVVIH